MPASELYEWGEWFSLKAKVEKQAYEKTRSKSRGRR